MIKDGRREGALCALLGVVLASELGCLGLALVAGLLHDRRREAVIIRQSDITEGIRRIEVNRLLEISEALLKARGRIFVPVIYSLKVSLSF